MAIKWKNNKKNKEEKILERLEPEKKRNGKRRMAGLLAALLCSGLAGGAVSGAYPYFEARAEAIMEENRTEYIKEEDDFYVGEEFERYLLSSIYYMNYEITPDMDAYAYFTQNYDTGRLTAYEQRSLEEASGRLMKNMRNQYTNVQSLNQFASYAYGTEKSYGTDGGLMSVIQNEDSETAFYQSGIVISYDSRGVPSIRKSWGMDYQEEELLGYLSSASMARLLEDNGMDNGGYSESAVVYEGDGTMYMEETYADPYEVAENNDKLLKSIPVPLIQNATFVFGVRSENGPDDFWAEYYMERDAFMRSGVVMAGLGVLGVMALLALILQNIPSLELKRFRIFRLPTEVLVCLGCWGVICMILMLSEFAWWTMDENGGLVDTLARMGMGDQASLAGSILIWLCWSCFAFGAYWLTASAIPYIAHPIRTLRENMLCISVCRWLKRQWIRLYHWATDIEVDEKLSSRIWRAVILNGVIVMLLCCIWFGGVFGAVIYSGALYVLVKKKCGQIQEDYQKLLQVTRSIAGGDLNTEISEDMGLLNPVRDELVSIQKGFQKAVREEVRSRNMKTELITNVSHDLKTPLTAIITYVDLLKKEDITEEERKDYIDTLDRKSQRLKALIEDLFEVSKATTNNITMNFDEVDLVNLIKQVRLENEDKIAASTLDIRWNLPEEKCVLSLDPQRTFRIIDNLVQNILKYSMPHSRVYIDMELKPEEVSISFKNMSEAEMNFSAEEITERFVRGDMSRNTEGSGLGLAIAQSFTELQNGTFKVEVDGDLFKVLLSWKR